MSPNPTTPPQSTPTSSSELEPGTLNQPNHLAPSSDLSQPSPVNQPTSLDQSNFSNQSHCVSPERPVHFEPYFPHEHHTELPEDFPVELHESTNYSKEKLSHDGYGQGSYAAPVMFSTGDFGVSTVEGTEYERFLLPDKFVTGEGELALKAKLLATLGWRMASYGAETRLIVQSVKKMAHDLDCHSVDLSITRDGIIVKLRRGYEVAVEFKEIKQFAINMDALARLHHICLFVSDGKLTDPKKIYHAIRAVRPRHYSRNQLIVIEALAGGCFAYLNGGTLAVCLSAIIGGLFLMYSRFAFIKRGFFESFTFMLSACIGSLIASLVCHYGFQVSADETLIAATCTTLLLVPGFPMLNGFLDIFKGYVPIGLTRLVIAAVLVISAAVGLLTTSYLTSLLITYLPQNLW